MLTSSQPNTRLLVDVAMGRSPADLVIRHGRWICVQSGEIISGTDIAITGERIAYVGPDASHTLGGQTQVIDADGRNLVPGLLDGHMHVESGMLTVTEFVRAVIPHGTTGMFIDPHEIANVFGLRGVRLIVDEAAVQPIHVWVQMPSCVPSAPGFETPGATIGPVEVTEAMTWPGIIGLGEVMNYPGVYLGDEKIHAEIAATLSAGKVVGGHFANPNLDLAFHGYAAGGPQDDHEGTRLEDALARVRQGLKPMLRLGSGWHDVATQIRAITELGLDSRHFILCTDDSHSETLVRDGHVNRAVRTAIANGVPPLKAIQMATLNTAEHFGVSRDVGQIAPGRFADILILGDLTQLQPDHVIVRGRCAAENGRNILDMQPFHYPEWAMRSIHLAHPMAATDFVLKLPPELNSHSRIQVHVIGIIENQAPTRHLHQDVPVAYHSELGIREVRADLGQDIAKLAVIERHQDTGRVQIGFVHGFGFNVPCAIGTTVAHDCHQMIVAGTEDSNMAIAANELARIGGGQVVVREGEIIGKVDLPIGGIMSNERAELVSRKAASVLYGFRACGCVLNNPNMQLSLLALPVIPELRITDLGLVDVPGLKLISVLDPR